MQESLRTRQIVFFIVLALGILFIVPTFAPSKFKGPEAWKWISRPISLGLDLSGGVQLLYEVQTKEAVSGRLLNLAQQMRSELRDEKIAVSRAIVNDRLQIELTLLSDRTVERAKELITGEAREAYFVETQKDGERTKLLYALTPKQMDEIERQAVVQTVETLRNRVDQFGVSEPLIQRVGEKRILLQMPGVSDKEAVKALVGSVAKLEFRLVPLAGSSEGTQKFKLKEGGTINLEDHAVMTGEAVADARVVVPQTGPEIDLTMTSEGARTFRKITEENVGRQLAIVLDGVVYSDPRINEPIAGGQARISGHFGMKEASQLAIVLRSGALSAPLTVLEERTVGPTLGKESIERGLTAIGVGFLAICIFMVIYYGKAGAVASTSLILNIFLLAAGLSAFGATLTLPGMAGLALTAGMAVDSNIIIFERIRDELRNGAGRDAAVHAGFDKAFSAIFDSNLTTFLSALVLYWLGSGPIRGFAVTLSLGVITTVYAAVFASRLAFDCLPLNGKKGLSI